MDIDISTFDRCRILVVGDLMLDEYIWGDVDRVSPEAPVPIVCVAAENHTLGGAGNVINNLVALGARVSAAGVVGTGAKGRLLLDRCHRLGVDVEGVVCDPHRPTTRKTRIIAADQQVLRIDWESQEEIDDRIREQVTAVLARKIPQADIVLLSDYEKGLIAPALLERLTFLSRKHGKRIVTDPKGLDFSKYRGVSLLTPNKKEASMATGIRIVDPSTLERAADAIMHSAGLDRLLITLGKEGMVLFEKGQAPYRISGEARQVYDVSGAGDTVLAVLGLALACGAPPKEAAVIANAAAGLVVGKVGTATISQAELAAALTPVHDYRSFKTIRFEDLPPLIEDLKRGGRRIVLTNGCFDFLHTGHVMLFAASKRMGDVLIVAIDDDRSVRRLKGPGRPVISARERVGILSALDTIDYVVVFSSGQLEALIETVRPDVLTKGSNYASEEVLGRDVVEKFGGRVALVPITEKVSSSRIIDNIVKGNGADRP